MGSNCSTCNCNEKESEVLMDDQAKNQYNNKLSKYVRIFCDCYLIMIHSKINLRNFGF